MAFSSPLFIFFFLPIFLAFYYLAAPAAKNSVALIASLLFYAWGAPQFLPFLLFMSWLDYFVSLKLAQPNISQKVRRFWLVGTIGFNLSILFYFKYSNFVASQIAWVYQYFHWQSIGSWTEVVLPIGISFVVFEQISYLVDVFRRTTLPAKRFRDYALFLFLFPHSIAGPIFRWKDLSSQFENRPLGADEFSAGLFRFCTGLAKKVLIADQVAQVADKAFQNSGAALPWTYAWVGLLSYSLQIYFDFSGYSDMAIGIGKCLGFQFKENFNAPYTAISITDFWRRWHISLSTWMKDYLYIPLGGNRSGESRKYFNLVLVFILSGLWHGANWTFVIWGLYHGVLLLWERLSWSNAIRKRTPTVISILTTFLLVMIGWVLFRAESINEAFVYFYRLFAFNDLQSFKDCTISWGEFLSHRSLFVIGVGLALSFAPPITNLELINLSKMEDRNSQCGFAKTMNLLKIGAGLLLLGLSTSSLVTLKFSPFIYFRF